MTFSSCPNQVVKKSCLRLLLSIQRVNQILCCTRPPVLLEPSAFLARVGRWSFSSGHFILLVRLMSMQQIMAPLSTRAVILAGSPPFVSWRIRGMVTPLLEVVVLVSRVDP